MYPFSIRYFIEGIYELIEVNESEVIFRNQGKLYKIENLVGK